MKVRINSMLQNNTFAKICLLLATLAMVLGVNLKHSTKPGASIGPVMIGSLEEQVARADITLGWSNQIFELETNNIEQHTPFSLQLQFDGTNITITSTGPWSDWNCTNCFSGVINGSLGGLSSYTNGTAFPLFDPGFYYEIYHQYPDGSISSTWKWHKSYVTFNGTNYSTEAKVANCGWGTNQTRLNYSAVGTFLGLTNFLYSPNCGNGPIRLTEEVPLNPVELKFLDELKSRLNTQDREKLMRYLREGVVPEN